MMRRWGGILRGWCFVFRVSGLGFGVWAQIDFGGTRVRRVRRVQSRPTASEARCRVGNRLPPWPPLDRTTRWEGAPDKLDDCCIDFLRSETVVQLVQLVRLVRLVRRRGRPAAAAASLRQHLNCQRPGGLARPLPEPACSAAYLDDQDRENISAGEITRSVIPTLSNTYEIEWSNENSITSQAKPGEPGDWTPYDADVCAAVEFLGAARASEGLPKLDAMLSDRHSSVQQAAALAMTYFGTEAVASAPKLAALFETPFVWTAAHALGNRGPSIGPKAVAALARR